MLAGFPECPGFNVSPLARRSAGELALSPREATPVDARQWRAGYRSRARGLSHPAVPNDEFGLWQINCERPACRGMFVTRSKQRRYCSESCRRFVEQQRAHTAEYQVQQLTAVCAASDCRAPFVRSRVNHFYCSKTCGQRARRAAGKCALTICLSCGNSMQDRTVRARYCSDACRVREARKRARTELRP